MTTSEIVAIVSIAIALGAVGLTLWQNILTRRAVQLQVLLSLKQQAKEAHYFEGIAAIKSLPGYTDFRAYQANESIETQNAIYDAVDFLNFVAHLVEDNYLPRQTAWNYYFHAYRICNQQLLPWWLSGIRNDRFQGFTGFEKMCRRIGAVSNDAIRKHEEKTKNSLDKK